MTFIERSIADTSGRIYVNGIEAQDDAGRIVGWVFPYGTGWIAKLYTPDGEGDYTPFPTRLEAEEHVELTYDPEVHATAA